MAVSIKVDEDLPLAVSDLLNANGHDAVTVWAQNMSGWKDPLLWQVIQSEKRFLVTADKGFGDIRVYPPGQHTGILILRPDEDGIRPVMELMQSVLAHYALEELVYTTTVATPRGVRIRRSPTTP